MINETGQPGDGCGGSLSRPGPAVFEAMLASLLGVRIQTSVNWSSRIRCGWTTYIADLASTHPHPHQGIPYDPNKCSPPVLWHG
jgi:hypothetical protein